MGGTPADFKCVVGEVCVSTIICFIRACVFKYFSLEWSWKENCIGTVDCT